MRWSEQDQVLEYQVLTPDKSANDDEEELEDEDAPDADMQVFAQIEREGGREREREGETQRGEREGGQVQARKAPEEVVALRTCTLMLNSCVCVCVRARACTCSRSQGKFSTASEEEVYAAKLLNLLRSSLHTHERRHQVQAPEIRI